jgi:hypothetical protein
VSQWHATVVCISMQVSKESCVLAQGAVLLDAAMQPRTVWEFEAVMVLLSGHWPPRGLVSGQPRRCMIGCPSVKMSGSTGAQMIEAYVSWQPVDSRV